MEIVALASAVNRERIGVVREGSVIVKRGLEGVHVIDAGWQTAPSLLVGVRATEQGTCVKHAHQATTR